MRNFLKIATLLLTTLIISSCESEDDKVVAQAIVEPVIISGNSKIELLEAAERSNAYTLVWDHADFDVNSPVTYVIEMDVLNQEFQEPTTIAQTTERLYSWSIKELNTEALQKGLVPGVEGELALRIKTSLGSEGFEEMISNTIFLTVTPYATDVVVEPTGPAFFMVGNFQQYYEAGEWTPTEAIRMNYIGANDALLFDAVVKMDAGHEFKFINDAVDWSELNSNLGTIGGAQDGTLENSDSSGNIKAPEAGLYYVQLDLDKLTYQIINMNWGIIGNATPGGWDGETAMDYDFDINKFIISTDLVNGELKFRSKVTSNALFGDGEDWKINVGTSETPTLADQGDGNFTITSGSKDLKLSFDFLGNATIEGL